MTIQNNNAFENGAGFSPIMQHRMNAMLKNADRLFSIGWLRKRLWKELGRRISEIPATEYENYGRWLRNHFEIRFMLEFLSAYQKSLASIRQIIGNAYDTLNPLEELMEEREELIRKFACMPLSKTWNCVRDDEESWRQFAHRFPFSNPEKKDVDYSRFFERFYREDESHNSEKKGFGIGLSMAERFVEMFRGKISVNYKDGMIHFTVSMPSEKG